MKIFTSLLIIIMAASCGRNTSGNGHANQSQNALIAQGSINLRCSEQSVARRCSIGISNKLLPPTNFLSPYCYDLYTSCILRSGAH